MGLIKAVAQAVGGSFADQWLEVIEPDDMGDQTVFTRGVLIRRGQNTKGTDDTVSNGSIIHVYDNQFMMLVDGGKIVDYTAEPGYYKVDNSSLPSLFNGQLKDTLKDSFARIKFGGQTPDKQKVFFINLQEIKGIPFGTSTPVNYFDNFYNSELMLRAHGTYSIKVVEPFKFYQEVIPREAVTENKSVDFADVRAQYNEEFVGALGSAINQYSADGERISFIKSKQRLIGQYMAQTLDEEWTQARGMEVFAVGMDVSYTEDSQELINMRNKGAMLSDAAVQQGYVAANISEGLKDAGSNANGAMAGFMGMGIGMNAGGNIMGGYQQNPQYRQQQPTQPQQQAQPQQTPAPQAGGAAAGSWTCSCGAVNTGKFCSECGSKKPEAPKKRFCTNCGYELSANAKFCPECGTKTE